MAWLHTVSYTQISPRHQMLWTSVTQPLHDIYSRWCVRYFAFTLILKPILSTETKRHKSYPKKYRKGTNFISGLDCLPCVSDLKTMMHSFAAETNEGLHGFAGLFVDSVLFSLIINLRETEVEELGASPGHDNTLAIQHTCAAACWATALGQSLSQHVEEVFHSAERPVPPIRRPWSQT